MLAGANHPDSNAAALIISILALVKGEIVIVQTSLIGTILGKLLFVLGTSFIAGGCNRIEQKFNATIAQTSSSLLVLAVGGLVVLTAFHAASPSNKGIIELSRGAALILVFVYASYLLFQLRTNGGMYNKPSEKSPRRNYVEPAARSLFNASASVSHAVVMGKPRPEEEDPAEEEKESVHTFWAAVILLAASTTLTAICSECLLDSIDHPLTCVGISKVFFGLILLLIVGNAADQAIAVVVAVKDKMDYSIDVAVGSSLQIALLIIPFIVVLGWIIGDDRMTLYFD